MRRIIFSADRLRVRADHRHHYLPRSGPIKALGLIFFLAKGLYGGIDPLRIYAEVHAAYLSTSAYCDTWTEAFTIVRPEFKDFLLSPSLGSLDNARGQNNGSYPCVALVLSEKIKFVPDLTGGNCRLDVEYSSSFCDAGTTVTTIDGTTSSCTAGEDDIVYMYFSTASASSTFGAGINPFSPPTQSNLNNGLNISSPITIRGARTVEFVVNGDGNITSSGGNCILEIPTYTVR